LTELAEALFRLRCARCKYLPAARDAAMAARENLTRLLGPREPNVIIGPTTTSYVDLSARTVTQSRTADGSWLPSALSDFTSLPGRGRPTVCAAKDFPTARTAL
jgi:hypothetical protein